MRSTQAHIISRWIKPTLLTLLLVIVVVCQAQNTTSDNPSSPLKIAVAPVIINSNNVVLYSWPEEVRYRFETNASRDLQTELFYELEKYSPHHRSHDWELQHFTDTNNRLAAYGYSITDSWELSLVELADLLGVDAVLQVSLTCSPRSISSRTAGQRQLPNNWETLFVNCPVVYSPRETFVEAGLFDGLTGLPYWSMGLGKGVRCGHKNKTIARMLIRNLMR
ncbi:MAG: hypothetical protein AAFQ37_09545 [Bacteroidota bacterium]